MYTESNIFLLYVHTQSPLNKLPCAHGVHHYFFPATCARNIVARYVHREPTVAHGVHQLFCLGYMKKYFSQCTRSPSFFIFFSTHTQSPPLFFLCTWSPTFFCPCYTYKKYFCRARAHTQSPPLFFSCTRSPTLLFVPATRS